MERDRDMERRAGDQRNSHQSQLPVALAEVKNSEVVINPSSRAYLSTNMVCGDVHGGQRKLLPLWYCFLCMGTAVALVVSPESAVVRMSGFRKHFDLSRRKTTCMSAFDHYPV